MRNMYVYIFAHIYTFMNYGIEGQISTIHMFSARKLKFCTVQKDKMRKYLNKIILKKIPTNSLKLQLFSFKLFTS